MSKKTTLQKKEIATISSSLAALTTMKLPLGIALGTNKKRFAGIVKTYFDDLDEIKDKYCSLEDSDAGYKLKKTAVSKKLNQLTYEDFDAGEDQKKYEAALIAKSEETVDVQLLQINLNRMVKDKEGNETTIQDKLEFEYDIPAILLEPLIEVIFIDK